MKTTSYSNTAGLERSAKRIIVILMTFFLVFSFNGFSMNFVHRTVESTNNEISIKGNAKGGHKPKKAKSKRRNHKSRIKKHVPKKTGNGVNL